MIQLPGRRMFITGMQMTVTILNQNLVPLAMKKMKTTKMTLTSGNTMMGPVHPIIGLPPMTLELDLKLKKVEIQPFADDLPKKDFMTKRAVLWKRTELWIGN
ncbi:hypothetical protein D3C86_1132630 [compost metagenome]